MRGFELVGGDSQAPLEERAQIGSVFIRARRKRCRMRFRHLIGTDGLPYIHDVGHVWHLDLDDVCTSVAQYAERRLDGRSQPNDKTQEHEDADETDPQATNTFPE